MSKVNEQVKDYIDKYPNQIIDFAINTVCNYDKDIIPYLRSEIGSAYIRVDNTKFEIDDESKPVFVAMQNR